MTVGQNIKVYREKLGMSQEELAKRLGYKDRSSISKIEKESDTNLSLETVQKIADVFQCSPLVLMGWAKEIPQVDYIDNGLAIEMSDKEKQFMDLYSRLDEYNQGLVNNMIEALSKKQ